MIDDGETDWKVTSARLHRRGRSRARPLAPQLNDIAADDVERHRRRRARAAGDISCAREWLRMYKTVDGKPENKFGMEERAMGREYAMAIVQETHEFWRKLTARGRRRCKNQ